MKNLILFLALGLFSISCTAQYYPNSNDGYYSTNSGWYGDDSYYFPDDYYYEYPYDYYNDDYYRSFYSDYRRSIDMVNWYRFFREMNLNRWQIEAISDLNNQFPSFYIWSDYYRTNPKRWYYDRFYALERILGSRVFALYQNSYYNGYNPVSYYNNYWRDYYRPKYYSYYVIPRYRNVNVNVYRVDRSAYHRSVGNKYGWNQPRNPHNPGVIRDSNNSGRNGNTSNGNINTQRVGGIRENNNTVRRIDSQSSTNRSGGLRNQTPERIQRNDVGRMTENSGMRTSEVRRESNRVFEDRSSNTGRVQNEGFRNIEPRNEGRTMQMPRQESRVESNSGNGNNSSGRSSGMRTGGR